MLVKTALVTLAALAAAAPFELAPRGYECAEDDRGCGSVIHLVGGNNCVKTDWDTKSGSRVVVSDCFGNGNLGGRWKMRLGGTTIVNKESEYFDFCLTAKVDKEWPPSAGAWVVMDKCLGQRGQSWHTTEKQIQLVDTDLCIAVQGGGGAEGDAVVLQKCDLTSSLQALKIPGPFTD